MKKIKLVMQMKQTECGLCVVQMLLNYYGAMVTLSELNEKTEVGRDGLSLKRMRKTFEDFSLDTKIFKVSKEKIQECNNLVPFVALAKTGHYIVVEKITKKGMLIVDPAVGKNIISIEKFCENYLDIILYVKPNESFVKFNLKKRENLLSESIKENKKNFVSILFISLIIYVLMFIFPILSRKLIDLIIINSNDSSELMKLTNAVAILFIMYMGITFIKSIASVKLSILLDKFLTEKVIDKLLKNDLKFFLQRTSADLQYRFSLLRGIKILLNEFVVTSILEAGSLFIILIYILIVSPKYLIVLIISTVIVLGMKLLLKEKVLLYKNEETSSDSKLQILQNDMFRTISDIKALGLQEEKKKQWSNFFEEYLQNHKKYEGLMAKYKSVLSGMNLFMPTLIVVIGAWYINISGDISEISIILSLQTILGLYMTSLLSISEVFDHSRLIKSYMARIDDIMNQNDEINGYKNIEFKGNIKVKNLSFKYPGDEINALSNINLEIKEGQKIAFTGATGSGKSTLLNVLVGLFKDYSGDIYIENINLKDIDDKCIRNNISVVPQNSLLFNGSLKENLDITGKKNEKEVYEALDIVEMGNFVRRLPMKLNTIISENGFNFSGGQRQRIALARAIINSTNVIFLDESTSFLDNITESKIVKYFDKNKATQIIVAHRLSTIKDADYIYVLKEGRIVESGSHSELLKLDGEYRALYNKEERQDEILSIAR